MFYIVTFLIALAFSLVCNYFDIRATMKGLRAKVAVEGNGMALWVLSIVQHFMPGAQMEALDLWMANAIPKSIICTLAAYIVRYQASTTGIALIGGPTFALVYIGIDHLRGVKQWNALLKKAGK